MSGLAGRIAARLDALEAGARAAVGEAVFQKQTGRWSLETVRDQFGPTLIVFALADGGGKTQVANLETAWEPNERGAHIAEWDPAAVLRLVDGLRAVVAMHAGMDYPRRLCEVEAVSACETCNRSWPCSTLLGIAGALGVEVGE